MTQGAYLEAGRRSVRAQSANACLMRARWPLCLPILACCSWAMAATPRSSRRHRPIKPDVCNNACKESCMDEVPHPLTREEVRQMIDAARDRLELRREAMARDNVSA